MAQVIDCKVIGGHLTCPCTPKAIYRLLLDTKGRSWLSGKHAVIVGRSEIVGKPIAELLLSTDCTTTICHSKTINLADITRQADILNTVELAQMQWNIQVVSSLDMP